GSSKEFMFKNKKTVYKDKEHLLRQIYIYLIEAGRSTPLNPAQLRSIPLNPAQLRSIPLNYAQTYFFFFF
ncbi:Hypothetical protein FKW44_008218, partial [Caligus rogercresseyi]